MDSLKNEEGVFWDLLEKHIKSELSNNEKDQLILNLCQSIESLKESLDWYAEGNHIVSTWYQREDRDLIKEVENSNHWKRMHTEDDHYIEDGERASNASYLAEMPSETVKKLLINEKKVNIMTNLNTNTVEKTINETFFNSALSKEEFIEARNDFREFSANKDNGPYRNSYGTKFKGDLRFSTYIFYAMLKNKDISKVTHSVESDTFKDRVRGLKAFGNGDYVDYEVREEIALIQKCFESLSAGQIKSIISSYFA